MLPNRTRFRSSQNPGFIVVPRPTQRPLLHIQSYIRRHRPNHASCARVTSVESFRAQIPKADAHNGLREFSTRSLARVLGAECHLAIKRGILSLPAQRDI